ncbi:MAG: hypothetical protein MHPSP_004476, partial [Paramarteilia canceri]
MCRAVLCLRKFNPPHTAKEVLDKTDKLLREWKIDGINDPRIVSFVTDNGSNMVKAFEKLIFEYSALEDPDTQASETELKEQEEGEDDHYDIDKLNVVNELSKRIPCIDHCISNNFKSGIKATAQIKDTLDKTVQIVVKIKGTQK